MKMRANKRRPLVTLLSPERDQERGTYELAVLIILFLQSWGLNCERAQLLISDSKHTKAPLAASVQSLFNVRGKHHSQIMGNWG